VSTLLNRCIELLVYCTAPNNYCLSIMHFHT
jgi:hypothetical protein